MDSSSETQQSPLKQKSEALLGFSGGPLPSSIAKVSGSSRGIPFETDFHFYYNFDEFKLPVKEISDKTQFMLEQIGASSEQLWGKQMAFPGDLDDAYDWVVNVNDEVFERFDVSIDEFTKLRKKEEETGVRLMGLVNEGDSDNGFQLVYGKKKKLLEKDATPNSNPFRVKVASKDNNKPKPKIPFHIPSIPRPQDQYKILVNNANQPFEHVWLQRSEDGSRFVHPLEKLSAMDFVDKLVMEPVKPSPVECTPYKLIEEVKDLKELASKLHKVNEFAVDLEHNNYRSFQGLTCLMQISTRTEDFIVDTLKLRIHIGPYLREVFKDPTKKKVMHGADQDIIWLQRDFGIYVCNMFDTGQASRVLKMERNSLAHLLDHFCGITANKEYQNADWRLRPLPNEMLRYAREDTHYLLHIHDLMRMRLLSSYADPDCPEALLIEVYKRSYEICMQLYEKEVLTESSYLYIYGLRTADFNAQQLAIVAGLCEWRDVVARAEDESTGFILPNKSLLEIAKQMPVTTSKLRHVLKAKHPYIERNLSSVVSIIRHSMQNSAAFEEVAKHLKELRAEMEAARNTASTNADDALHSEEATGVTATTGAESHGCSNAGSEYVSVKAPVSMQLEEKSSDIGSLTGEVIKNQLDVTSKHLGNNGNINDARSGLGEASRATVEVQKKPNRAFGALLGNTTKRKFDPDRKAKEEIKVEQIKSSVNLPFHSFTGRTEHLNPGVKEPAKSLETKSQPGSAKPIETFSLEKPAEPEQTSSRGEPTDVLAANHKPDDVILLESDSDVETTVDADSTLADDKSNLGKDNVILLDSDSDSEKAVDADVKSKDGENKCSELGMENDDGDEPMSLSDLSSSFQKCLQTTNRAKEGKKNEPEGRLQLKPFDYEAARKSFGFGEDSGRKREDRDDESHRVRPEKGGRTKNAVVGEGRDNERVGDFQQGRRRQAFPATGNRSATFR